MSTRSSHIGSTAAASLGLVVVVLLLLGGGGCERGEAGAAGGGAGGSGGNSGSAAAEVFSRPPIPVAVQAAVVGPIATYYSATATLEVEKEAEVLARVSGLVESLAVEEGDRVREDDLLLEIENEEYRVRLDQANSATRNFRAKFERLEHMRRTSEDLVSAEEFDTARNDYENARAQEELARLNLSYTGVTSPFTGRVVRRLVDVGENVSIGTPLFVVADFDPLLARVHVPAKEFRKIQVDQTVELTLDSDDNNRLQGRILLVSPVIDPNTGTIKITVEIPEYTEGTRPGDFAEVRIVTERRPAATLVPRGAVITDKGGERVVFVADGGRAERREVEVGFEDDDSTQILDGVQPGEVIVIKGQRSLKHGYPLKILETALPPSTSSPQSLGS